jgi:hypothetical protein
VVSAAPFTSLTHFQARQITSPFSFSHHACSVNTWSRSESIEATAEQEPPAARRALQAQLHQNSGAGSEPAHSCRELAVLRQPPGRAVDDDASRRHDSFRPVRLGPAPAAASAADHPRAAVVRAQPARQQQPGRPGWSRKPAGAGQRQPGRPGWSRKPAGAGQQQPGRPG